jgi:hypothetical protein
MGTSKAGGDELVPRIFVPRMYLLDWVFKRRERVHMKIVP